MDIKYTPLEYITSPPPISTMMTQERSWPFKLTDTYGEEIYLNVYESEIRAVLKQMSDIVEGL